MKNAAGLSALVLAAILGCASSRPDVAPSPPEPPRASRPEPPHGPTRTDFKTIAQKLVQSCVGGGWISRWRSTAKDVDQARPRIALEPFEDKTGQGLDPEYLGQELERRMRTSGVFDLVGQDGSPDFRARGKLLRLAERTPKGERISVYTATLELIDPASDKIAYSCEATVRGEL